MDQSYSVGQSRYPDSQIIICSIKPWEKVFLPGLYFFRFKADNPNDFYFFGFVDFVAVTSL